MPYILPLNKINGYDVDLVGAKAVSLSEMLQIGLPVPNAFVISTEALRDFLTVNQIEARCQQLLLTLDRKNKPQLLKISQELKKVILSVLIPKPLALEIFEAYEKLIKGLGCPAVAIRTSRIDDHLTFLFHNSLFLNVSGEASLLEAVKACWAQLYNPENLRFGYKLLDQRLGLIIQEMVVPMVSGLLHTIDITESDKQLMTIEAIYGNGEYIIASKIKPDRYFVQKHDLTVVKQSLSVQTEMLGMVKGKLVKIFSSNLN